MPAAGTTNQPPVPILPPTATGGLFVLLTGIALRARRVGR